MDWQLTMPSKSRSVVYWPQIWKTSQIAQIRGGNPILFPFAARSYDRGVENAWRSPDGKRRPMPRHGFARDGRFEVVKATEQAVRCRLCPTEEAKDAYPFDYAFFVEYRFNDLSLQVAMELHNEGEVPVPWSAGHHFYFTLPWNVGATRNDYRLLMDARKSGFPDSVGKLALAQPEGNCHSLGDSGLIERVHWELRHSRISWGPRSGEEDVHLIVGKEDRPPKNAAIVTWTESGDSPFYCIEPWMGPPNAAEHGKGLHWVHPGETGTFEVEVSLL